MDLEATLKQAIVAAKSGRKAEARHLLETVLDVDERNEQAWLWLSGVVKSHEEQVICLQNVLTVNPHNEAALKGLETLRAAQVVDLQDAPTGPGQPLPAEAAPESTISGSSSVADRRVFIVITVALMLILICTVMSILAFVVLSPVG